MKIDNWKQYIGEPAEIVQRHEKLMEEYVTSKYEGKKHVKAEDLKPLVGEDRWEVYFKFAFVRNPWDRAVSTYLHRRKVAPQPIKMLWPASQRLFRGLLRMKYSILGASSVQQVDYLTDKSGNLLVDFVGRFEDLKEDFQAVCERIGIDANLGGRYDPTNHSHYGDYYDETCRRIIEEVKNDDIEKFGYRFERMTRPSSRDTINR